MHHIFAKFGLEKGGGVSPPRSEQNSCVEKMRHISGPLVKFGKVGGVHIFAHVKDLLDPPLERPGSCVSTVVM